MNKYELTQDLSILPTLSPPKGGWGGTPITVFYHANCADGFGAAYALYRYLTHSTLPDSLDIEFLPTAYVSEDATPEEAFPDLHLYADRTVFVVDFSFPSIVMADLLEKSRTLYWFDHHAPKCRQILVDLGLIPDGSPSPKEALRYRVDFATSGSMFVLTDENSGALLTARIARGYDMQPIPELFHLLDDYDRYVFRYTRTRFLHAFLNQKYGKWSFSDFEELTTEKGLADALEIGRVLYAFIQAQVNSIVSEQFLVQIIQTVHPDQPPTVIKGCAVISNFHPNEVADELLKFQDPERNLAVIFRIKANPLRVKCSFRSRGTLGLAQIVALLNGGNGHLNAAGATIPMERFLSWISPSPESDVDTP